MRTVLEVPEGAPGLREIARDFDRHHFANGVTAFLFAVTGPLAILLTVAIQGRLSEADISSWVFAAYALSGAISIVTSVLFRQPLGLAWTIPGTVLLTAAWDHVTFPEVVGAYLVTGVLLTALGLSGWVSWIMRRVPMPVVMGMVAGVFLPLALKIVAAFGPAPGVAAVTVVTFIVFSWSDRLSRHLPPVLAALVIGTMAVVATGGLRSTEPVSLALASPLVHAPRFSLQALVELVVPLAITVVAIQNGQGIAVLTTAGYKPPINTLTTICGLGSLVYGLFGSVPTCVTGPVNAILTSSGERKTNYIGGIVFGLLMLLFGVFSPTATRFALALPLAFIGLVGGLALLRVLQGAFNAAFSRQFQLGALVSLVVTFSDMKLFNIGAAFWGLVFGFLTSCLLERQAFRALRAGDQSG